jgi:hypothetical protein
MNFWKEVNTQGACPLFKLTAELRNEIYFLVFTAETNADDDSVELNERAATPSMSLTMTCQVIRSETRAMYKAAYQKYPKHSDQSTLVHRTAYATALSDAGMMIPSQEINVQNGCPLFDLAVELRNEIYSLVFAVEAIEDDSSIKLNETTAPPSRSLSMTCQVIRSETRSIY